MIESNEIGFCHCTRHFRFSQFVVNTESHLKAITLQQELEFFCERLLHVAISRKFLIFFRQTRCRRDSSMGRELLQQFTWRFGLVQTTSISSELLRPREAADWLKISERTLWSLTQRGELPAVRIGRSVRYELADLIQFVAVRKDEVSE